MQNHADLHTLTHECREVCLQTHTQTYALQSSSFYCLLTAFVLFFLSLSNLSGPAKICFLSPGGCVHTDATFQLSEERGRQRTGLINLRSFWQWNVSQGDSAAFLPSFPPFLTFLPVVPFFLILPYVSHNSALRYSTWLLFSLCVSLRQRLQKVSVIVSRRRLGSNYQGCRITALCVCVCL